MKIKKFYIYNIYLFAMNIIFMWNFIIKTHKKNLLFL